MFTIELSSSGYHFGKFETAQQVHDYLVPKGWEPWVLRKPRTNDKYSLYTGNGLTECARIKNVIEIQSLKGLPRGLRKR